jgi:metal-responsive CopG/Arc/MetJ family transcriptional regulator
MSDMKTEKFTVTLPQDLAKQVRELAKQESRNVSNMTTVLLREAIKNKAA